MTREEFLALPIVPDFYEERVVNTGQFPELPIGHTVVVPRATRAEVHFYKDDDFLYVEDDNGVLWTHCGNGRRRIW